MSISTEQRSADEPTLQSGFERIEHADLGALTYKAIRKRILLREFRTGEQIPVGGVAQALGVSRTPVIDALKRLESEGLVEIRARRGTFVRGLTANDIRELLEVREAIELFSVRAAIRTARNVGLAERLAEIARLMEACTEGDTFADYDRFIEWDRTFHDAIVETSNNARMMELYRSLHAHQHIMRAHYFRELVPARQVNAAHAAIIAALCAGDVAAAERAVSDHVASVCDRACTNLRDGEQL